MKKRLTACMLAFFMILLVGCSSNTAKEAAKNETKTETSFPAGNTETQSQEETSTEQESTAIQEKTPNTTDESRKVDESKAICNVQSKSAEEKSSEKPKAEPSKRTNTPTVSEKHTEQSKEPTSATPKPTEKPKEPKSTEPPKQTFDVGEYVSYVKAYMELPDVRNTKIYRIDPELLLEKVLGLTVEYQHLSYDGSILGMTSFTELGVQVLEDDDNEAFFFLDGKTVLVEKDLAFDNKLRGRKNFTLMHEGSHQIFKTLFPNDYGVTQKSSGVHYYKANSERNKPISDWEEWQANTLGAAILLPETLIKQGMFLFNLGDKIECLNKIYSPEVYKRFEALADFLGCSKKALAIRMKQLGLLKKEYLDNPFDIINIYPEGCSV